MWLWTSLTCHTALQANDNHLVAKTLLTQDKDTVDTTESQQEGATLDELVVSDLCGQHSEPRDPETLRELLNSLPILLDPHNSEMRNKCLGPDAAQIELLVQGMAGQATGHSAGH